MTVCAPGRRSVTTGRGERGSATIWVIAFAAVVLLVAMVGAARAAAVLARHRLDGAADFAALAAAEQIGRSADPCAAATMVAAANHAELVGCSVHLDPDGRSGAVVVAVGQTVTLPIAGARRAVSRSRAARLPP